jgi:hypothetical protein
MAASSAGARRGAGSDDERGAPLVSTGRGAAASALTCGREDSELCSFAEGSASDPQKQKAIRRLYIAMVLCGTFMLVRCGARAVSLGAPAAARVGTPERHTRLRRWSSWAATTRTPWPSCPTRRTC